MITPEVETKVGVNITPKPLHEVLSADLLEIKAEEVVLGDVLHVKTDVNVYKVSREGLSFVINDFVEFITETPELLEAYKNKSVTLEQHLLTVVKYMWEATGDHTDSFSMVSKSSDISAILSRRDKPKTRCNVFNSAFIDVFWATDKHFGLGFENKVALVYTGATAIRDFSGSVWLVTPQINSLIKTPHGYINLISKDSGGVHHTSIDPYHTDKDIKDPKSLDFTTLRASDFLNRLLKVVPPLIESEKFCKDFVESDSPYSRISRVFLLVELYLNSEYESNNRIDTSQKESYEDSNKGIARAINANPKLSDYYEPFIIANNKIIEEAKERIGKRKKAYEFVIELTNETLKRTTDEIRSGTDVFANITDISSLIDLLIAKGVPVRSGILKELSYTLKVLSTDREKLLSTFSSEERDLIWQRVVTDSLFIPPNLTENELVEWVGIKMSLLEIAKSSTRSSPDRRYVEFKSKLENSKDPKAKVLLKLMWG